MFIIFTICYACSSTPSHLHFVLFSINIDIIKLIGEFIIAIDWLKLLKIQGFSKSGTRGNIWRYNSGELRSGTTSKFYFWFLLRLIIILLFGVTASVEQKLSWDVEVPSLPCLPEPQISPCQIMWVCSFGNWF